MDWTVLLYSRWSLFPHPLFTTLQPGRQALLCGFTTFTCGFFGRTKCNVRWSTTDRFLSPSAFLLKLSTLSCTTVLCVSKLWLPFSFSISPPCFLSPLLWSWPWHLTIVQQSLNVKNITSQSMCSWLSPMLDLRRGRGTASCVHCLWFTTELLDLF